MHQSMNPALKRHISEINGVLQKYVNHKGPKKSAYLDQVVKLSRIFPFNIPDDEKAEYGNTISFGLYGIAYRFASKKADLDQLPKIKSAMYEIEHITNCPSCQKDMDKLIQGSLSTAPPENKTSEEKKNI